MHQPQRPVTARGQFIRLLDEQGSPPQVIRLRQWNCSNAALPGPQVFFAL
jgi:predicted nuclease of predicted toxin-antitoxin system